MTVNTAALATRVQGAQAPVPTKVTVASILRDDKIKARFEQLLGSKAPGFMSSIINITNSYNVMESFTAGFAAGAGFTLAIVLMSNIREKLDLMPVRRAFRGMPIAFISAGLMALSFMAFDKALLTNLHLV